jgi:sulfate adenylyltransferase subunit 2
MGDNPWFHHHATLMQGGLNLDEVGLLRWRGAGGGLAWFAPVAAAKGPEAEAQTALARQILDKHGFDVAIGGSRRDEERSRAKERIFSLRLPGYRWEPRRQRPELWRTVNSELTEGQTMRAFPLSNWTELDVWRYTRREGIPVVPLYYAAPRPVVVRSGSLIVVDDDRMPLEPGETPEMRSVRFRSLGCYPLSAAVASEAATLDDLIAEMEESGESERAGRLIDGEGGASMEAKKVEGYF